MGGPVNNNDKCKLVDVLHRTTGMTAPQRLVVMLHARHPNRPRRRGHRDERPTRQPVGMSPTVFSRIPRQAVEAGWLEESECPAHISYYRLSAKGTGEDVVVPLRRAT
ncbi:replication initiation protein, RepL2 [Streptomyces hundungensis]|uniref:replication initiation protein, RepL2 n=1 Tax=Streptomyces hundungensis TaxID=1077946 RepID=UPI00319E1342